MTTVQKFWLIFIAILVLDFDLTAIVYGNKLVSLIGLIARSVPDDSICGGLRSSGSITMLNFIIGFVIGSICGVFCLALVIAGRDD